MTEENVEIHLTPSAPVPGDTVAVVAIGGELTNTEAKADSYAKMLRRLMAENDIDGASVYSVYYLFGNHDANSERIELFRRAGRRVLCRQKNPQKIPDYVAKIYDAVLRPRISSADGKRIPTPEAEARIGRLTLYAHCHGAAVIVQMANLMRRDMAKMGYTNAEIDKIQKNLLVVQHSPIAPLEHPRFTTLSFASAEDTQMNHYNTVSEYIAGNSADVLPSYLSFLGENLFVASKLKSTFGKEHDHRGMLRDDDTRHNLTPDGKIIFAAQRNALINGVRRSQAGASMPPVSKLVSDDRIVNFDDLNTNGEFLKRIMTFDLQQQNLERGRQK